MLWNRSYNLTPGWSLGFFSWTEHNVLFQEKEIWVHSSNKDYRLGSNLAHTSVRADVYCSRNQVMLVYPGCPLHWQKPPHTPLSVGGAGFRLKGSWDLDQRQHAPEQCWQSNSTYFYPTFSLAITTEMLLLQMLHFLDQLFFIFYSLKEIAAKDWLTGFVNIAFCLSTNHLYCGHCLPIPH